MNYANLEKNIVQKTYALRQKFLSPLLSVLTRIGLTANRITYLRGLLLGVMVYELFINASFVGGSVVYIIFLILDGLDGALARYQNASSDLGRFNDIFVDILAYSFMVFGLAYLALGSTGLMFYQVIINGAVYLLAVLAKNMNRGSDWLIHAEPNQMYLKVIATVPFLLLLLFKVNLIDLFVFFLNLWMTVLGFYYFIILQKIKYEPRI